MTDDYPLPDGLRETGAALWRKITDDVEDGWTLDARDLALLDEAARLADRVTELEALVSAEGMTVLGSTGQSRLHPAVTEIRMSRQLIAQVLGKIDLSPPSERTGQLSGRQRQQLRDARAKRWGA